MYSETHRPLLAAALGPCSRPVPCLLLPSALCTQHSPAWCSYSVLRKDKYKFNLKQHLEQEAKKQGRILPSGVSYSWGTGTSERCSLSWCPALVEHLLPAAVPVRQGLGNWAAPCLRPRDVLLAFVCRSIGLTGGIIDVTCGQPQTDLPVQAVFGLQVAEL